MNQNFLKGWKIKDIELIDDDYNYIINEINMNYTSESLRKYYQKKKEEEKKVVSNEDLLLLGYTEQDILNKIE